MVDKVYCMSSYLAFRYIERDDMDFYPGLHHHNIQPVLENEKTLVRTASDIERAIERCFGAWKEQRLGLLLSGGMDSGCLASFMPEGADAYTFVFDGGAYRSEELERAEKIANICHLRLHHVPINWDTVERCLPPVMKNKAAPVHSIEPQIYQAALQAKADGIDRMLVGESADLLFGGMDKLLSKDWTKEQFMKRYTFLNPTIVLQQSYDISYVYDRYDSDGGSFDFLRFMDEVFSIESSSSYLNAFRTADMPYSDPYAKLKMAEPLDLYRVRHGEPKYLVRELFQRRYPGLSVPDKIPMPRPVDQYFINWQGPTRPEFRDDIDMLKLTGDQKWQLYCLEKFLNEHEPCK